MGAPRFSVIIVNYNGRHYLQGALDSLKRQTVRDFEVFVVDNASTDGSADGLDADGLPHFELIKSEKNLGFAAGNNLPARRATGAWIALLNPDAAAHPDWLEKIAEGVARHPAVRMFACLQLNMSDPERLDGIGDAYFGFGIPWRGGFGRSVAEIPPEGSCFSPCGASAVYHRETFLAHGGFDEDFFCFGEDTDLAFRMRLTGETCVFLPDAVIAHEGGGVSGRVSEFALFHGARNRVWTYVKGMPGWSLWLTLPGHIGFTLLILARGMMTGRFWHTWRGIWASLKGLGPVWKKRRAAQKARRVSVGAVLGAMAWNPLRFLTRRGDVRPFQKD